MIEVSDGLLTLSVPIQIKRRSCRLRDREQTDGTVESDHYGAAYFINDIDPEESVNHHAANLGSTVRPNIPATWNRHRIALCASAITIGLGAGPLLAAQSVTLENFKRAESDHYFSGFVAKGCFGKLCSDREPVAVDQQTVIRMNRDTPYTFGVFDLSTPVTIVKPDVGRRFQSIHVVNQDHYAPLVAYAPGRYTLTREKLGTRYVLVVIRTFMDPNDSADVKAAHAAQNAVRIEQARPGKFEAPDWDAEQRAKMSAAIASLMPYAGDNRAMFGPWEKVDPVRHLIGTAAGWGGNPLEDATYVASQVSKNDGTTPYVLRVGNVPVDGFWSVTVYNEKGFYEAPETAISVNSVTGRRDPDGTVTIRFGGDPSAANYLRIMPGWNYTVRMYRPRSEVLSGKWAFPEAVEAR